MTADPLAQLVEGIVSDRAAREERLKAMVDQLVGRPAPPHQAPPSPPAQVPVPAPVPPAPAGPDPVERFREEIAALRIEKEELAGKNLLLYEELQRALAPPLVKEDTQRAMFEGLVVELRAALAKGQAALAEERDRASGLEARLEAMAREARERDERESQPGPDLSAEFLALRAGNADLAGKNAALYEELQRAQAGAPQLEARLQAERAATDQAQAALAQARADRARLEEMLKARETALAEVQRLLEEERQARIRLEVAHRAAEVQVRTLEETLRQREQVLARPPAPAPAVPPSPPPAPPEPVRTPSDAAGQIQATRQAWLDAILKELSKR